MRVAFLLRDHFVQFYLAVSRGLEARGFSTYWITNSRRWRGYLLERGVGENRLVFVPTHVRGALDNEDAKLLRALEERLPELTVSKWILSDRALQGVPYEVSKGMLGMFATRVRDALVERGIETIVGELTFSIELVAYYLSRDLGIPFLYPDSVKIPSERFAFFESPAYGDEFMRAEPTAEHLAMARTVYDRWKTNREKPHFWHVNLYRQVIDPRWPLKAVQWLGETDYISANVPLLVRRKSRQLMNRLYAKVAAPFRRLEELDRSKRFAIYPLHKQPEASVDITAPEFSDQLATIRNIARSLPLDFYLLVKEHPLAIESRGREFYRGLSKIPNVILLDPYEDSYRALDVCDLILTICSTMGYEGALLGKPVIVFSKVFYGGCPNVRYCSDATRLPEEIKNALGSVQWNFDETLRFVATVVANSYPGVRGHPSVDPKMMQRQNIEHWIEAFSDYARRRAHC